MKSFSDKEKQKNLLSADQPLLQEMLKGVLQDENK